MVLTAKEQEIIDKVKEEKLKYKHPEADLPHEQDNIPNPFDVLTLEESYYLREHPYLLDVLNDFFKSLNKV